jgi:hypothetical protein
MRVIVAVLAFAPVPALACAMPPRSAERLAVAMADIDAELEKPAVAAPAVEPAKPEPAKPAPTAIPEVTPAPVVQPRS